MPEYPRPLRIFQHGIRHLGSNTFQYSNHKAVNINLASTAYMKSSHCFAFPERSPVDLYAFPGYSILGLADN